MEYFSLLLIFWYGVLHAFGPDHLSAIADFSIGKNKQKTITITLLFAFGHGLSLLVFAKILEYIDLSQNLLSYADLISASVILFMGVYLLFLVFTNRININKHIHNKKEHLHIYFGKEHNHSKKDITSALSIGILMGIGGVRGMLVTLSLVQNSQVNLIMVLFFTLGVMLIFVCFGAIILYINENLLHSKKNVRRVFFSAGIISLFVGSNILFS